MVLSFESRKLREICTLEECAIAEFGEDIARSLISRLADLRAAHRLGDIIWMNSNPNNFADSSMCSIEIPNGYRLSFRPNHKTSHKDIARADISRIKITSIAKEQVDAE